MKKSLTLLIAVFVLTLSACSTLQKNKTNFKDEIPIGVDARLQIQNKAEKKTFTVVMEAIVVSGKRARVDVTGPFGALLGRLIVKDDDVAVMVPQQKRIYLGRASERSFLPLLPLSLHPSALGSLLRGEVPNRWNCGELISGHQTCQSGSASFVFQRETAEGKSPAERSWSIENEQFKITCLPNSVTTKVQIQSDTFLMPQPIGFTKHKLP